MSKNSNGKPIRRTVTPAPAMDEQFKRLAKEWKVPYTEVVNIMLERGMTVEAAFEAGFPVVVKTPGKEIPLNDDRPIRRALVDNELRERLKRPR